jgi:Icc protein
MSAPPRPAPIRLVQLTDFHLFEDPAGQLRKRASLPSLEATLAAAAPDIAAAEAVLATGDLVQDEPPAYAHVRRLLGALGKPVRAIPGNHDDAQALARALDAPPFTVGGHLDLGNWRIVLLDSSQPGRAAGHLSEGELQRLEEALSGAPERHALVVLHHQPLGMDSDWLDGIGLGNAAELLAIIERHPGVRGILFGHVHQAFDGERQGLRLMGTPSTCAQFRPRVPRFEVDSLPPAWRRLALHADGSIDTSLGWVSGAAG